MKTFKKIWLLPIILGSLLTMNSCTDDDDLITIQYVPLQDVSELGFHGYASKMTKLELRKRKEKIDLELQQNEDDPILLAQLEEVNRLLRESEVVCADIERYLRFISDDPEPDPIGPPCECPIELAALANIKNLKRIFVGPEVESIVVTLRDVNNQIDLFTFKETLPSTINSTLDVISIPISDLDLPNEFIFSVQKQVEGSELLYDFMATKGVQ